MTTIDLARVATCDTQIPRDDRMETRSVSPRMVTIAHCSTRARLDAEDLAPARGIAFALIVSVPMWSLIGLLIALAVRWS